jgi:signal transduction histidine kinase
VASDAPTGVPNVLRTGRSELYRDVTDEMLVAVARDPDHLRLARELRLRSVMIVPIKDRATVLGAISFVLSSDRRYTDDDLVMAEQLAERAGAAIANARLYAAAQDAVRIRDDFMLIAGHELRTPLMALSLHHEALRRAKDDLAIESVRERGAKLRVQTDRISRLVDDLLDVSRISAGRVALEPEELDFGEHVAMIVERMRDELDRTQTPVSLAIDSVRGRWDRSRTDQIITNLLGNAAKYGRGAPIAVRVQRRAEHVDLVVADRGIGIALEDQPRIFRRFERATSAQGYGGLGLGLWITSQLVEAHGGTIAVESQLGAGSTFTVSLPIG